MILELARQSVRTKLRLGSATMLGNYEFYYAAGILCRELKLKPEEDIKPKELYEFIRAGTDGVEVTDETAAHLLKMIHFYIPEDHYDDQMRELMQWGMDGR